MMENSKQKKKNYMMEKVPEDFSTRWTYRLTTRKGREKGRGIEIQRSFQSRIHI